jgi:hypothetical protein
MRVLLLTMLAADAACPPPAPMRKQGSPSTPLTAWFRSVRAWFPSMAAIMSNDPLVALQTIVAVSGIADVFIVSPVALGGRRRQKPSIPGEHDHSRRLKRNCL